MVVLQHQYRNMQSCNPIASCLNSYIDSGTLLPSWLLCLLLRLGLDPCDTLGRRLVVGKYQHVAHLDMHWPARTAAADRPQLNPE
jgi:hypothetical protein